jgi:NitT/TauT family transport system substrate-binding protein
MTSRGKLIFTILFLAIVGAGVAKWWPKIKPGTGSERRANTEQPANATPANAGESGLVETQTEVPRLDAPGTYASKDGIVDIELSEYIGYAGLIVANGGLDPNPDSVFAKKHGFKLRIKLSEEESWSALNSGKMAASATTVDVLAVYGRQFNVVVPVQIAFSRGADGVVVNSAIKRVNDLKGKVLASAQFTEADFFIRYLAQEAGMGVKMLASLDSEPDPNMVNLVYAGDAFAACDAYTTDATGKIIGCVTWAPKTTETVQEKGGKAAILTTNKNLLIIADILVVNKGFATAEPDKVKGLVAGIIEGNMMVKNNPDAHLDTIAKAFTTKEEKWDRTKAKSELQKVHLSNGPENLAFFAGAMDAAGSFAGIYQTAVYSYGSELLKNPVDSEHFAAPAHLKALEAAGAFTGQTLSIAPIKSGTGGPVEGDPLLSKNIRFLFQPNSAVLDPNDASNTKSLAALKQMLQVSPGSEILLRGHVDNSKVEDFRKQGGEPFVRQMAMKAMDFSKQRAEEIKKQLIEREKVDAARIKVVGRGWEEPLGTNMDENRRVEAQWFTLE